MDPYKILGVSPNATLDEIEAAYREKAKKHHPDRGGDAWAFQQVHEAYEELRQGRVKGTTQESAFKAEGQSAHAEKAKPSTYDPWNRFVLVFCGIIGGIALIWGLLWVVLWVSMHFGLVLKLVALATFVGWLYLGSQIIGAESREARNRYSTAAAVTGAIGLLILRWSANFPATQVLDSPAVSVPNKTPEDVGAAHEQMLRTQFDSRLEAITRSRGFRLENRHIVGWEDGLTRRYMSEQEFFEILSLSKNGNTPVGRRSSVTSRVITAEDTQVAGRYAEALGQVFEATRAVLTPRSPD